MDSVQVDILDKYDSFLLVSFGGPEGAKDVVPFLENVLRGKAVPHSRMMEVAEHYQRFGGVSPINAKCRELIAALEDDFLKNGLRLPIYWGNRNWHPLLTDTMRRMADDGRKRTLAFFTSTFSSYSGCRQYRENIAQAQSLVGDRAPIVDKLRMPFNHPGFIEPQKEILLGSLARIPEERRKETPVFFTAHSIPQSMAGNCNYELQLREAARLIVEGIGNLNWELVFQSRSGSPAQTWLEPDVLQRIKELHEIQPIRDLILQPIGFVSDHMEVIYDLDVEAAEVCLSLGINLVRSPTIGIHPRFVGMIRELITERMTCAGVRPALGTLGPSHDICPTDCCLYPQSGRPSIG